MDGRSSFIIHGDIVISHPQQLLLLRSPPRSLCAPELQMAFSKCILTYCLSVILGTAWLLILPDLMSTLVPVCGKNNRVSVLFVVHTHTHTNLQFILILSHCIFTQYTFICSSLLELFTRLDLILLWGDYLTNCSFPKLSKQTIFSSPGANKKCWISLFKRKFTVGAIRRIVLWVSDLAFSLF